MVSSRCFSCADSGSDDYVCAINPNGTQKWRSISAVNSFYFVSPAFNSTGDTIYIGSFDTLLYAYNSNDGTIKWTYSIGQCFSSASIGSDGTIYIGGGNNLYAIIDNGSSALLKWSLSINFTIITITSTSSVAIDSKGILYVGSTDGILYSITDKGTSGQINWQQDYAVGLGLGSCAYYSSPAISKDGTIYIGYSSISNQIGCILAVNSINGSLKWVNYTTNIIISSPAIGKDGTIYIGSLDHNLYAIN